MRRLVISQQGVSLSDRHPSNAGALKLNVLHLHLSDAESAPAQSQRYPRLWDGALSPGER